jgi:hypothetical protein
VHGAGQRNEEEMRPKLASQGTEHRGQTGKCNRVSVSECWCCVATREQIGAEHFRQIATTT